MRAGPLPARPTDLAGVHREFEHWRRTHRARAPLPARLWARAVAAAREAGVHATARRLRLNYYALKRRVADAGGRRRPPAISVGPAFVEVVPASLPPAGLSEGVIELADTRGTTMRIALKRATLPDLVTLSQAVWRART